MYYIGYDIGSSSVKVALVHAESGERIMVLNEPQEEMGILSIKKGWAEQNPDTWWKHLCSITKKVISQSNINAKKIQSIGISYQMHGLVLVDKNGSLLRDSIIWCDSRAVEVGKQAFSDLGEAYCMEHLLNSPGNFTASKLKWVKENEPDIYEKIYKYMLPGDYINYRLTGEINTTKNALSEGILWDYKKDTISEDLLNYYDLDAHFTPDLVDNFAIQGKISATASEETGLPLGASVVYRAGDQPNNALSLNIFKHGEVAATGGTSGVVYAVTKNLESKEGSRINHFAHVNYSDNSKLIGKLLCINGAGIQYRWLRNHSIENSYENMNRRASKIKVGSDGAVVIPFGNGVERMLNSKKTGAHIANLNFNIHSHGHLYRAALEGIAFSFVYGMEILKADGAEINVIRAGNDNLFRSEIFSNTVGTLIEHEIEIYNTTGAVGAARASGIDDGNFEEFGAKSTKNDHVMTYVPLKNKEAYIAAYENWKNELNMLLNTEQK